MSFSCPYCSSRGHVQDSSLIRHVLMTHVSPQFKLFRFIFREPHRDPVLWSHRPHVSQTTQRAKCLCGEVISSPSVTFEAEFRKHMAECEACVLLKEEIDASSRSTDPAPVPD